MGDKITVTEAARILGYDRTSVYVLEKPVVLDGGL